MARDPKAEQILRNKAIRDRQAKAAQAQHEAHMREYERMDRAPISEGQFGIRAEPQIHQREQARERGDEIHGPGWYQRPLPGLGHLTPEGKSSDSPFVDNQHRLPVNTIFHHDQHEPHPAEYHLVTNYNPEKRKVKLASLRPTQPRLNEHHLHAVEEGKRDLHPQQEKRGIGVVRDSRGRNLIVDGHHRAARALLRGDKTIEASVWDAGKI